MNNNQLTTLQLTLGNLLEKRGEWTPELRSEIEALGEDGAGFMEACINLLEGKIDEDH